jgi:methionine-gamma-lyase
MSSHDHSSTPQRPETGCIHAGQHPDALFGGVSVPIYQSSTFAFSSAAQGAARFSGQEEGYKYTRLGNPTAAALEECIAALEGGVGGIGTASGMAAISTVFMTWLGAGKHLVSTSSVYGPTRTLVEKELSRFGVESSFVDTSAVDEVKRAMRPNTAMVYVETPANPTLAITDIQACAEIAQAQGALLVVDNTFCSPILQRPLDLGADVVLHSMTKFINGHSDVVAGMLVAKRPEHLKEMRRVLVQMGGSIDPNQAWLVLRGVKTLALRVRAAQESAAKLARDLSEHRAVATLDYPGLPSHPQHELAKRQMKGFGAMISFEVKGGVEAGRRLMDSVKLCTLAVSLGGVETLIQHPASMTHASMGPEGRKSAGITDGLVRLAVGCEAYEDLKADLFQALDHIS